MKTAYYLTIFFPSGTCWECADGAIRTRQTRTGAVVMRARKCSGEAWTWLRAAPFLRNPEQADGVPAANMPAWARTAAA